MTIPKKKFFFQGLAVVQLPILPVISVDTLHQLQIHVGLDARVICHYKFIFLRVSDLLDAFYSLEFSNNFQCRAGFHLQGDKPGGSL